MNAIQTLKNRTKPHYILYIVTFLAIFLSFSANSALATDIDYSVTIEPSLTLTIPTSSLVLNLDPSSKTFDSKNLNVSVGTNNKTGYKLTLSTPNDNTDLERDTSGDTTAISATIPTLDTVTYTESTFTANKWGYKINTNTAIPSTITSGYIPFVSGSTLMERGTAVNQDQAELTFASKIDYLQPSGSYATTLQFNIVANPLVNYMQDFTTVDADTMAINETRILVDKRDSKEYTVAKLADGNVWMISNLNLAGGTKLYSETSDVPAGYSTSAGVGYYTLPTSSSSGFSSDTTAYVYNTGNETTSQADCTSSTPCNSYYSWLAATAGGKDTTGAVVTGAGYNAAYSICPRGWRLPTATTSNAPARTSPNWKTGDYYKLATAYGANLESQYSYQGGATFGPGTIPNFLFAGGEVNGGFYEGGSRGRYWSSTANSSTKAENILIWATGVEINSDNYGGRRSGFSVRCLFNDPRTISDVTTMQEMNPQIAAKMNNGDTTTLKDSRDGQDYTIAKINGNVWMTRNLAIGCDGTGSAYGSTITSKTLTSSDSNISAATWSTPTSSLKLGDSKTTPRMECSSVYGAWYNLPAATAGTIVGTSTPNNSTYDICPSGWRIQSNAEGTGIISYSNMFNAVTGGRYYGGRNDANRYGYWWSSTAYNATIRYVLAYGYNGTNLTTGTYNIPIDFGAYIRCIAK